MKIPEQNELRYPDRFYKFTARNRYKHGIVKNYRVILRIL